MFKKWELLVYKKNNLSQKRKPKREKAQLRKSKKYRLAKNL